MSQASADMQSLVKLFVGVPAISHAAASRMQVASNVCRLLPRCLGCCRVPRSVPGMDWLAVHYACMHCCWPPEARRLERLGLGDSKLSKRGLLLGVSNGNRSGPRTGD